MSRTARIKVVLSLVLVALVSATLYLALEVHRAEVASAPGDYNSRMQSHLNRHIAKRARVFRGNVPNETRLAEFTGYLARLERADEIRVWEREGLIWMELPTGAQYSVARGGDGNWQWRVEPNTGEGWRAGSGRDRAVYPAREARSAESVPASGGK